MALRKADKTIEKIDHDTTDYSTLTFQEDELMALSQHVIFARIKESHTAHFTSPSSDDLACIRPALFEAERDLSGCAIVITQEELRLIPLSSPLYEGSLFISIGVPSKTSMPPHRSLMVIEDDVSVAHVFNDIQEVFVLFADWENDLKTALYNKAGFQEMSARSELVFKDPFCVQDKDFRYISYSEDSKDRGLVSLYVDSNDNFPLEIVNELLSDPEYITMKTLPGVYVHSLYPEQCISKNLFHESKYVGQIVVQVEELTDTIFGYYNAVLTTLSGYMELLYARYKGFTRDESALSSLRGYMTAFLNHKDIPSVHIEKALLEVGWKLGDDFRLIQVRATPRNEDDLHARYIAAEIMRDWQGCIVIEHFGKVLILENDSHFSSRDGKDFFSTFVLFLRDNLLSAGVSRVFQSPQHLSVAFDQTEVAFEYGSKLTPMYWCHRFDDFALPYLLDRCLGPFAPEDICSEKYLKLKKYDEEKNTELRETLITYYECRFNASAAAEKLCIHRTSFLNRMERIKEISGINFESTDELLYVALSQKIL